MALTIKKTLLSNLAQRSSARRETIQFTVSHHSTVIGNGSGLANAALRSIWLAREASAGYGVDGSKVAMLVPDNRAAWATANSHGNHGGVSIEHANSSGPPSWRLSALTLLTGAQLVAELHVRHNLGRPRRDITMKRHSDFFPTACPGPFFGDSWANYCHQAGQHYDLITNGKTDTKGALMALSDKEQDELLRKVREVWSNMPAQKGVKTTSGILARDTKIAARDSADVDAIAAAVAKKLGTSEARDLDTTKRAFREVLSEGVSE